MRVLEATCEGVGRPPVRVLEATCEACEGWGPGRL